MTSLGILPLNVAKNAEKKKQKLLFERLKIGRRREQKSNKENIRIFKKKKNRFYLLQFIYLEMIELHDLMLVAL